jgi:hypothetical protein
VRHRRHDRVRYHEVNVKDTFDDRNKWLTGVDAARAGRLMGSPSARSSPQSNGFWQECSAHVVEIVFLSFIESNVDATGDSRFWSGAHRDVADVVRT